MFVFYTVSTWSPRKRVDLLVDAFCAEFGSEEQVMLFVKTPAMMEFSEHGGDRALVRTELAAVRSSADGISKTAPKSLTPMREKPIVRIEGPSDSARQYDR